MGTSLGPSWRGLAVRDGALVYRIHEHMYPWRHEFVFSVDGAVVRHGRRTDGPYAWSDFIATWPDYAPQLTGKQWCLRSMFGGRSYYRPLQIRTATSRRILDYPHLSRMNYDFVFIALAKFVAATPRAQSALTDTDRVTSLVAELQRSGIKRPLGAPSSRSVGAAFGVASAVDEFAIHDAVERALRELVPRPYGGRLVRGQPVPDDPTLVAAVRTRIVPSVAQQHATDDEIQREITRFLDCKPWPFDVLTR